MSVEARLEKLETQHRQIDANQHSLAKVCADIKHIALTNQHDVAGLKASVAALADATHAGFKRTDEQHNNLMKEVRENQHDITSLKASVAALADATHAGFKRTDEQHNGLVKEVRENHQENRDRFDQLELLIRQLAPNASN